MLLHIPRLLDAAQLASVTRVLEQADFVDGRLSAGKIAGRVKRNQELDPGDAARERLVNAVLSALLAHPVFRYATYPARLATPIFARYTAGMAYGDHVDDPLMGGREPQHQYRSDISYTLFLSEPEAYAGGALVLHAPLGEQRIKAAAGDLVSYPSAYLHRVEEVTSGQRLVMVGWLQSQVRDPARRQLLHDLWQAREQLLEEAPDSPVSRRVDTSYVNLLRMWAET